MLGRYGELAAWCSAVRAASGSGVVGADRLLNVDGQMDQVIDSCLGVYAYDSLRGQFLVMCAQRRMCLRVRRAP